MPKFFLRSIECLFAFLATSAVGIAGDVWVVNEAGGGHFTDIQPAVNAAQDGDVILVLSGSYSRVIVDDKELTITVEDGHTANSESLIVVNLAAGKVLSVSGLTATATQSTSVLWGAGLYAQDCAGSLRLRDCTFTGGKHTSNSVQYWPGAHLLACSDVGFSNCELQGAHHPEHTGTSGNGLESLGSRVALYGSSCIGGSGSTPPGIAGDDAAGGGTGILMEWVGGALFAANCFIAGGNGATGTYCGYSGWGGDGIQVVAGDCLLLNSTVTEGQGGGCAQFCGWTTCYGWAGDGIAVIGTVTTLPGTGAQLFAHRTGTAVAPVRFRFEGEPGSHAYFLVAGGASHEYRAAWSGVLLAGEPYLHPVTGIGGGTELPGIPLQLSSLFAGVIPASGDLVLNVSVDGLGFNAAGQVARFQGLVRSPGGTAYLTDAADLALLDCAQLPDCDGSGNSDVCELQLGAVVDCNGNSVPDSCEPPNDCNANGVPDECDLAGGASYDLNQNGIPDECEPPVLYVDAAAPPGGDGGSWATAMNRLQDALDPSNLAREVWIRAGTYAPLVAGETSAFELNPGFRVYGGFAGWETSLDQRDVQANVTTLSGDALGDDSPGFGNRQDNAKTVLHILSAGPASLFGRLDGVTIRGGYADGADGPELDGGGIYLSEDGSHEKFWLIVNCTVLDNWCEGAGAGAFMDLWDAEVRIANCRFLGNVDGGMEGHSPGGAGLFLSVGMYPVDLVNCLFSGNQSLDGQGYASALGLFMGSHDEIRLSNLTFSQNHSSSDGGALHVSGHSQSITELEHLVLWGNTNATGSSLNSQIQFPYFPAQYFYPSWSCIEHDTGVLGAQNINTDPRFVNPPGMDGVPGTADDDLRLGSGSPCVDAGRNALVSSDLVDIDMDGDYGEEIPIDLAGNPRRIDDPLAPDTGLGTAPIVDLGALERVPPP